MNVGRRAVRVGGLLVWLVVLGAGTFFPAETALAAAHDNGYSLTLTESTLSMFYGNFSPTFQAFLAVPAGEPPMPTYGISVVVDGSLGITGDITESAPNYTLTVPSSPLWRFEPGLHTVVAKYLSVPLDEYIYSQQLTFTVKRGNATLSCPLSNELPPYGTNTYPANTQLNISFLVHNSYTGGNTDVDVEHATYTVIFVGAQTFTYANIKPPIAPDFSYAAITTPPVPGLYTMRCLFNGTSLFSPTESDAPVTLQSTSGTPSPTATPRSVAPTSTPGGPQVGPGGTPTGSGTPSQPGAIATPTGAVTSTATAPAVATAPATGGSLPADTTPPPSSGPAPIVLWALAAGVIGAGGFGLLFWRRRKMPVSPTA